MQRLVISAKAIVKKAVIVLMLLITPFAQARAALVCSMMHGQIVEHCCCAGEARHAPSNQRDAAEGACCEVVIEVSDQDFAGVSADRPVVKRVDHDAPDTSVVPANDLVVPTLFVVARRLLPTHVPDLSASRLYLRTARLRL